MLYYFFLATFLVFYFIMAITYYKLKSSKAFLNLQQSAYDNSRFFKFIKGHYKATFSVNELFILIFFIFLDGADFLLMMVLASYFMYYNLRFLNIANSRFISKLKLNITMRVRRQIVVFTIINIISLILLVIYTNLLVASVLLTYLIYPILFITNTILIPIEKYIKLKFKKQAVNKLESFSNLFVIGVTGSYGKTSIKNMVGGLLSEYERTLITPESYNTPMGLTITINKYLEFYHQNFIAEMGAYYSGEIKELADMVSPKVGIVSSVGPQHLETFKTIENICKTKMELIEALPSDGLGILNYDNEYIRNYKVKNNVKCVYYSLENPHVDLYASHIKFEDGMMTFDVTYLNQQYPVKSKLLGRHNVENILAAILVAINKGYDIEDICRKVYRLQPVKNRLEYKYINEQLSILDDAFNSNVDGIKEAINILHSFEHKRRIIITPGLIDLGPLTESFHNELGILMADKCDDIFVVGKLNRDAILKNINKEKLDHVYVVDDFITAYNQAINLGGEKVVLIANDLPDKFNE